MATSTSTWGFVADVFSMKITTCSAYRNGTKTLFKRMKANTDAIKMGYIMYAKTFHYCSSRLLSAKKYPKEGTCFLCIVVYMIIFCRCGKKISERDKRQTPH
jgi:hypothetical protein